MDLETMDNDFADDLSVESFPGTAKGTSQKEIFSNKLLPYAAELDDEARVYFSQIKSNLGRAVLLQEIQPGCSIWTVRLCKYITIYGMKFSKEDHVLLIELMYELLTIPDLEPYLIHQFGTALLMLLKKKELITPEELELPWEPLYRLTYRVVWTGKNALGMYRYHSSLETILAALAYAAKVYFPVSATQEILDELRPYLCPLDETAISTAFEILEWFLPVNLRPQHRSLGYQLWFDEFMSLWEVCHNAPVWEEDLAWLMARLASNNIGYVDWEPHVPLMFTRFVRSLNLPVTYKHLQSSKHHKIDTSAIAMWIVSVLGHGSCAQNYLTKFLKTIESYFHPANYGQWLGKLRELLNKLPFYFVTRVQRERYGKPTWEDPIPESHKLTDEDINQFVLSMKPVVMTAMFGKMGGFDASCALRYLSTLRPNLIIPDVLDRLYSVLDSLTEPHKLTASMNCVIAVARPMVQGSRNYNAGFEYPEGPSHVLPLLFSCLPGIDPNDARKCFVAFHLISVLATLIPIVDSSRTTATLEEDEREICESTSRFEDFIMQFLDRVFNLIDSSSLEFVRLESRSGGGRSRLESLSENALDGVCFSLLTQTSDSIFKCALRKLRSLVTERILETKVAGQLAAVLCRSFSRVNGKETLHALIPPVTRTILDSIGDGDEVADEEDLDHQLLYNMLLLSEIVDTNGNHLLPYIDVFSEVLDKTLYLKSREGAQIASRLIKRILWSLSTLSPVEYKSSACDYNDPEYVPVRDWGQAVDHKELNVKWYVPGPDELAAIQKLFSKYLPPIIARIEEHVADKQSLSRDELLTNLNVMNSILIGCESFLPVWSEPCSEPIASRLEWTQFQPTIGLKGEIRMPDGGNTRRHLARVVRRLQTHLATYTEDDIKSLLVLTEIWATLLLGKIRLFNEHEMRRKKLIVGKRIMEDRLKGKQRQLRSFTIARVAIQHDMRVLESSCCLTETHKLIMLELMKLGTSRYSAVRSRAQSKLFAAMQHFPFSYRVLVPEILNILGKDTEEHHEAFKGMLYIISGPKQCPLITKRDWSLINDLWPAIVTSQPSEKLSVIRLKENLVGLVHKLFPIVAISVTVPSRCLKAAARLWDNFPEPTAPQPTEVDIEDGRQALADAGKSNEMRYNELLEKLMKSIVEGNLHWRQRLMAMGFIRDLVHPQATYPANVARYFLDALIHESLEERKIAIKMISFILTQQKRAHPKVIIDPFKFDRMEAETGSCRKRRLIPGKRTDNAWLQYNYESRPLTAEQWDEPRFVHRTYVGFYTWPKVLKVYAPSSEQPCLDATRRVFTPVEKEIHRFFDDESNVEKLVRYLSLEEKKGKDKFNNYRCLLFKGLFRNHGDAHLHIFLPHLRRLVADEHESGQRCAAEMVAGIIRGSKHWTFPMTRSMWEVLLPIIRTALRNLTVDTVADWGICFATSQERRDPNRQHWLLECLMEEPPLGDSEASFVECGRLYAVQGALNQQSWRTSELLNRLLRRLQDRLLANPFQNVRERLGSIMTTVFDADLAFDDTGPNGSGTASRRVMEFIESVMPRLKILAETEPENPRAVAAAAAAAAAATAAEGNERSPPHRSSNLSVLVDKVSIDGSLARCEERELAVRLLKTLCKWLIGSLARSQYGMLPAHYRLFPLVCELENSETDEELSKTCTATLAVLARSFTLPRYIPTALEAVVGISESSSWWARASGLEFLQVLVFHNMSVFLSSEDWVNRVKRVVLRLLEDERLEVREKAAHVLGGLLHCTFIPDQETLLSELKVKAKTRLGKRQKFRSVDGNNGNRERCAETSAVRIRHAGVLGLCAFIDAHPYDVPSFLPAIFEELGPHLSDPQPIPATIRKTLGDFKRTHYDGWAGETGHKQYFTEEQLAVIQDLIVPPTYFA